MMKKKKMLKMFVKKYLLKKRLFEKVFVKSV
jgi:hypothetical protein